MNVTLLGADSVLGVELATHLRSLRTHKLQILNTSELDLCQPQDVRAVLRKQDVVLNLQEYDDLDKAEAERKTAYRTNIDGVRNLAYQAYRLKVRVIQFSSANVFDGSKDLKYTERDIPNPINIFGSSKFISEKELRAEGGDYLIVRTSAVYGSHRQPGHFLYDLVEELRSNRGAIRVVDNQLVNPCYAAHLAQAVPALIEMPRSGIVHVGPDQGCSWYEFAQAALQVLGEDPLRIQPSPWEGMGYDAPRPPNIVLDNHWFKRWTKTTFPDWREGVKEALA